MSARSRRCLLFAAVLPLVACGRSPATNAEVREVQTELGPGSFDLADPRAGLLGLSSYAGTLTVSFDGTKANQSARWSTKSTLQVAKSPPVRFLAITSTGTADSATGRFMAQRSGAEYAWTTGAECSAVPLDSARSEFPRLEPAASLPGVLGAEAVGTETLNGMRVTHYKFDERALAESGLNKSTGELWLAAEGGYVVRYRLATKGDTAYFGTMTQGTMTWEYELSEVNRPMKIEWPKSCPPALVDAPMLPDRASVESHPGVLRYETPVSVADAVAFYKKELGTLGWRMPNRSNPMAAALSDPEMQAALADPKVRATMKAMGLRVPTQAPQVAANPNEWYEVFSKGRDTLRVLITRGDGEVATRILLLNRAVH
jgi:hypothetical protein